MTWRSQCNYTKSTVFVNNWSVRMFPTCTLLCSWWLNSICILAYIHEFTCILVFVAVNWLPKKIYSSFLDCIFNNNNYVNASDIARNMMYINLLQKVGVLNNSFNKSIQFAPLRMQWGKQPRNLCRQTNLVHAYSSLHMKRDIFGTCPIFHSKRLLGNKVTGKYCVDMLCSINYIPWWRNIPCNVIVRDVLCSCASVCA